VTLGLVAIVLTQTPDTVDPAREAIESYIDATGRGGEAAGFPWALVVGLAVVLLATFVLTIWFRRRLQ
jgi:ABC-type multidrug transport system permease subunit